MTVDVIEQQIGLPIDENGYIAAKGSTVAGYLPSGNIPLNEDGTLAIGLWDTAGSSSWRNIGSRFVAIIGDSIGAYNSATLSTYVATSQRGSVVWMNALMGSPFEINPLDNFAVSGSKTQDVIDSQLASLSSSNKAYNRVFISLGTNDTWNSVPVEQIKSNFLKIYKTIIGLGAKPVQLSILPRGTDASVLSAKVQNNGLNQWFRDLELLGMIDVLDGTDACIDLTNGFGNILTTLASDGLHPDANGAFAIGSAYAKQLATKVGLPTKQVYATSDVDIFSVSNNPLGVLNPATSPTLATGTGGGTGITTSGGTWAARNRTLDSGQIRKDRELTLAASTTHTFQNRFDATGGAAWTGVSDQLKTGDVVQLFARVQLESVANVSNIYINLADYNGTNSFRSYSLINSGAALSLNGSLTLDLATSPIAIREYSGSSFSRLTGELYVQTVAGGAGKVVLQAFEMRKVG